MAVIQRNNPPAWHPPDSPRWGDNETSDSVVDILSLMALKLDWIEASEESPLTFANVLIPG